MVGEDIQTYMYMLIVGIVWSVLIVTILSWFKK